MSRLAGRGPGCRALEAVAEGEQPGIEIGSFAARAATYGLPNPIVTSGRAVSLARSSSRAFSSRLIRCMVRRTQRSAVSRWPAGAAASVEAAIAAAQVVRGSRLGGF
jgi:hypothetical protein